MLTLPDAAEISMPFRVSVPSGGACAPSCSFGTPSLGVAEFVSCSRITTALDASAAMSSMVLERRRWRVSDFACKHHCERTAKLQNESTHDALISSQGKGTYASCE